MAMRIAYYRSAVLLSAKYNTAFNQHHFWLVARSEMRNINRGALEPFLVTQEHPTVLKKLKKKQQKFKKRKPPQEPCTPLSC